MLKLQSFVFNPFQENTYIIHNDKKQCWIVDPGMYNSNELSHFTNFISQNQLVPQAIINTHTHLDHIFGVSGLMELYNIPFGIHEKDNPVLNNAAGSAAIFGFEFNNIPKPTFYINENTSFQLGDDEVTVLFVPGHSPGSIAFYAKNYNWVISGDTLFQGSIGRTDLPGGNHAELIESIKSQLFTLPANTVVLSGHGPSTSIEDEIKYNPFLNNA